MPGKDGLEAIAEIQQANPDVRILVLTSFAEEDKVFPAMQGRRVGLFAQGLVAQTNCCKPSTTCIAASRRCTRPSPCKLIRELNQPSDLPPVENPLTEREVDVLKLVAQGLTNQEIADRLVISEWTVRTHVRNILGKLHLANRTQAALYALREGLAHLD